MLLIVPCKAGVRHDAFLECPERIALTIRARTALRRYPSQSELVGAGGDKLEAWHRQMELAVEVCMRIIVLATNARRHIAICITGIIKHA